MLVQLRNQQVIVARHDAATTNIDIQTCALLTGPLLIETGALRGPMSSFGAGVPLRTEVVLLGVDTDSGSTQLLFVRARQKEYILCNS